MGNFYLFIFCLYFLKFFYIENKHYSSSKEKENQIHQAYNMQN